MHGWLGPRAGSEMDHVLSLATGAGVYNFGPDRPDPRTVYDLRARSETDHDAAQLQTTCIDPATELHRNWQSIGVYLVT